MNNFLLLALILTGILGFSQVGVNTPTPETTLDVRGVNHLGAVTAKDGILVPRVSNLTTNGSVSGQLVYLVADAGSFSKGFYYWNGSEWRSIKDSSSIPPGITTLNCSSVSLSPKSYVSGSPYVGNMSIAYTGGNGASYSNGSSISSTGVTGLNATLRAGTLNAGDGVLIYDITGTPNGSTPSTAVFAIPTTFGATGCNAVVGAGNVFAIGEVQSFRVVVNANTFFTNHGSNINRKSTNTAGTTFTDYSEKASYDTQVSSVQSQYIVINGLRMDFVETPFFANSVSPVLFNTNSGGQPAAVFNISSLSTNDVYSNGANTSLPAQRYSYRVDGDDQFGLGSSSGGTAEYVNAMLTFPTGEWYQLTYHATRDATNVYFYFTAQRLN
ncbi:hypothetical protein [Chryseobacterium sp. EO14]|nr:hypothetical protein [Chryseobacterium sp. EO14]MCQ4142621.1 hypothetical protein [Chryseobacterium sp. EO14]